ncbi:MAG: hypothetical protein IKP64_10440 [Selenomonadaceae bacterium]|nr:hypothetical protein [Selenomonadaceae bacterium]
MSLGDWISAEVAREVGAINRQVLSRARRGTNILRNSAMEVLGQNGSGRRYRNGHVASAPGQPPAPVSGNMRRNWREASFIQANGLGRGIDVKLQIKSNVFYAQFLEHGTRRMSARPFVERIKTKARPEIEALFAGI